MHGTIRATNGVTGLFAASLIASSYLFQWWNIPALHANFLVGAAVFVIGGLVGGFSHSLSRQMM